MEPLSALSLAAAVAQFVHFGVKVLGNAREIYGSLSGATEENNNLENVTRGMQRLTDKLVVPTLENLTDDAAMLNTLVAECRCLSLLKEMKLKDSEAKIQYAPVEALVRDLEQLIISSQSSAQNVPAIHAPLDELHINLSYPSHGIQDELRNLILFLQSKYVEA
ncbi:hypothetical protein N657DRAFT_670421 [Parathielavia appendiculata]|uniref:Fungal N-terminal domain-containing protein n=1 Tax=Parathielavia appendiculata TaxID=2587402 RepID=A0AAN6U4P1_9PEZI|nr:hypothetical protein N657DRAFT_670421 [Parathielavia appendiculata]